MRWVDQCETLCCANLVAVEIGIFADAQAGHVIACHLWVNQELGVV